jgi:hypothetical protein
MTIHSYICTIRFCEYLSNDNPQKSDPVACIIISLDWEKVSLFCHHAGVVETKRYLLFFRMRSCGQIRGYSGAQVVPEFNDLLLQKMLPGSLVYESTSQARFIAKVSNRGDMLILPFFFLSWQDLWICSGTYSHLLCLLTYIFHLARTSGKPVGYWQPLLVCVPYVNDNATILAILEIKSCCVFEWASYCFQALHGRINYLALFLCLCRS